MEKKKPKEKKQRRRGKGEGTVYQRPDGTYAAQIYIGINPETGKPKRKTVYGKTSREVSKKLNKIRYEVEEKKYVDPSSETIESYFNNWYELKKPHLASRTATNYRCYLDNHIIPLLGKTKLKDLTIDKIQLFINQLMQKPGKTGVMDSGTIKLMYVILMMGLKKACREKKISYDIINREDIMLPKRTQKPMKTLTHEELTTLLKSIEVLPNPTKGMLKHQQYKARILFSALFIESVSGVRRGELLGIKWNDFNLDARTIDIKQQWTQESKFDKLKTESSYRIIALTADVCEYLKWFKAQQNEIKLALGEAFNDNDLVFCYQNGRPIPQSTFYPWWSKALENAGIKHIRLHDMRHTFVTLGLEEGIEYKTLQSMTGHKSIKTFFDIYGHVTKNMQETAAAKIGERVNNVIPFKKASSS